MRTPKEDPGSIEEVLCCPRCAGPLGDAAGAPRCTACAIVFPVVGQVKCLVGDPTLWRIVCLRRLDDYAAGVEARVSALRETEGSHLLARTRGRLLRIAAALERQLEVVSGLFEPLDAGSDALAATTIPSRADPAEQLAILEGYDRVFRDWSWGASECERAAALVASLLPERLDRLAILGAGAGRTAVEIHQASGAARTLAIDMSPLPVLVADKLLRGETVALPEFPSDPRSDEAVVVERVLGRPFPARPGLELVLADTARPPVRGGSLDAVVTPWFLDAPGTDPRETAAAVNRVLRPGGWWVNVGPLRSSPEVARASTIEEVLETVAASGFEVSTHDQHDVPAFDSPVSGTRGTELVFRFAARKTGEAAAVEVPDPAPPWVVNPLEPIPITPAMVALGRTSMFTTAVLGLIDGERAATDVARELARAWGVDPAPMLDELRAFLRRLPG